MLIFWLMFLIPAAYVLNTPVRPSATRNGYRSEEFTVAWALLCLFLTLMIGYRYEVGGDWGSYLRHLKEARYESVSSAIAKDDPAYRLLNLLAFRMDWGIAGVNVISAFLFSIGLATFCRSLARPWLGLAVAIPYLVIVVGMGYTRQGVALGLAMFGLVALARKENRWFVFWVLCAAAFHKSAVLLLPIAALAATHNRYWTSLWVGVISLVAYYIFLDRSVNTLYTNYIEAQYESQGAVIRTAMNLIPACLFLALRRRFNMQPAEANLWRWFSIISIILFLVAITTPATTAVDRIALYMLPLQLVVFSYLPDALGRQGRRNNGITLLILLYYASVLFVWLNYAMHARYWYPYRFYPLEAWF
jgi:EpsG family